MGVEQLQGEGVKTGVVIRTERVVGAVKVTKRGNLGAGVGSNILIHVDPKAEKLAYLQPYLT